MIRENFRGNHLYLLYSHEDIVTGDQKELLKEIQKKYLDDGWIIEESYSRARDCSHVVKLVKDPLTVVNVRPLLLRG